MALYKVDLENDMRANAEELYRYLIYVCTLKHFFPDMVNYWLSEIRNICIRYVDVKMKDNIDWKRSIQNNMMKPFIDIKSEDFLQIKNVTEYTAINKDRITSFYVNFIEAAKEHNSLMLDDAIQTFKEN